MASQPAVTARARHHRHRQHIGRHWLDQKAIHADIVGVQMARPLFFAGDEQQRDIVQIALLADHPGQLHAGAARQRHVQQNQIRPEGDDGVQQGMRIAHHAGVDAALGQHRGVKTGQ